MFGTIKNLFGNKVDLKTLIQEGAIVVDVRTVGEFKSGHAPKSINMPLDALDIKKLKQYGKPIITCCASGMRSSVAANQLKAAGLEAYNGGTWNQIERLLD
jgi:rhodanese-related sulfurtransferase